MMIIVFGLPGSGKSYFASRLADKINADYINSDKLRRMMIDKRTYTANEKLAVYDEMLKQALEAGKKRTNIVLDATFYKNAIRKIFIGGVENGADIRFIEVRADESLIRERLKKPREYSEADFEVYKKIKKGMGAFA
jgi:predicted kinase